LNLKDDTILKLDEGIPWGKHATHNGGGFNGTKILARNGYMIHVMLDNATFILTLCGDPMGILWWSSVLHAPCDLCEHLSAEPLHSRRTHSHSERCRDRTEPHMRICSGCTFWVWCVARTLRPEEAARFIACMSEHATHNGGGFSGSLTMSTSKRGAAQSSKTSVLQRD
jgi:hypothetical protein